MDCRTKLDRALGWLVTLALALVMGAPAFAQTLDPAPAAPAHSAKLPAAAVPAPPSGSSSYSWRGFYLGGNVGYGWGHAETVVTPLPDAVTFINLLPQTLVPDPTGFVGGGQAGYNYQSGWVVLGVEADFSGTNMDGTRVQSPIIQNNGTPFPGTGNNLTVHQDTNWFGTVRGRVGVTPVPRLLIYGTGGLAYGHVNYRANTDFRPVGTEQYPVAFDRTKAGWVLGGGGEIGVGSHWSVRAEYLRYDLGDESIVANPVPPFPPLSPPFQVGYRWQTVANVVRGGINYRF